MRSRYFRQRSTGQWLEPVISSRNGFSTPIEAHIKNMEDGYNLPGDVEAVEIVDGPDPRRDAILRPPAPPPPTLSDLEIRLQAIEQYQADQEARKPNIAAATTLDELKQSLTL